MKANKVVKTSGDVYVPDVYLHTTVDIEGADELQRILLELNDAVRHINNVPQLTILRDKLRKIWDSLNMEDL